VKPLIVEEAAELELIGSVAFYEQRKTGLGLDFAAATRQALNTIAAVSEPRSFRNKSDDFARSEL
jgi:hypothetical protein